MPPYVWAMIVAAPIAVGLFVIWRRRPQFSSGAPVLAESRQGVRLLAEHVVDMVSTHDRDGAIRYASPVFAGLVGEYPGILVGKMMTSLSHADDQSAVGGLWKRALAARGAAASVVWRCRRHNGEYAWLETTARATAPEAAELGAIVCASRDITERKQIEDALRDSEQRFRSTLETVRLVAVGLDTQGRITFANESLCALTGWKRSELIGEPWFEQCIPAGDPSRAEFMAHVEKGAAPPKHESEIVCKDGRHRMIEWDHTLLRGPAGEVQGTASLGADVTERRSYEADLRQARDDAEAANRAKSEFLSRMSHDLRTPLNSVIGFANVMRKNKGGRLSPEDVTFLERITANGQHLLTLVNNLLDLAKVESGRLTITSGIIAVDGLVKDVVAQLSGQPRPAAVDFRAESPQNVIPIETDGVLLRQVLINLAGNALRFTHAGSVVLAVEVDRNNEPERILVRDTGIGIPANRLAAIFEPFEQADEETNRKYGGTGLGLAISKSICEALGYSLTVESKPGEGSTFTVRLS